MGPNWAQSLSTKCHHFRVLAAITKHGERGKNVEIGRHFHFLAGFVHEGGIDRDAPGVERAPAVGGISDILLIARQFP
jgi:hypothetical protein